MLRIRLHRCLGLLVGMAAAAPGVAAVRTVTQVATSFSPSTIVANPGDTVRWIWSDSFHTVTSGIGCAPDGRFDAPLDSFNPVFQYVIPADTPPGTTINYFCQPHCFVGMTGIINVQELLPPIDFVITLDGGQEVGPVTTAATGTGTATLDPNTNLFSWNITFSGLGSPQTLAHFHGPALPCEIAGIVITLPLGSPIVGSRTLTATQANDLLAGRWYVNVHTMINGSGEIRGQVMPAPLDDPIPAPITPGAHKIGLEVVASGLAAPNWAASAPGQPGRLFVSDQNGLLVSIDLATGERATFLDVSSRLVALGVFGPNSFDERGFLGFAFHPDYATNGKLYTFTSEPVAGPADYSTIPMGGTANCQSVVAEWTVPDPSDPASVPDPGSRRELLRLDKPQFNHNGGALVFGPDGLLYISTGDGGGADDRDFQNFIGGPIIGHGCGGNGANRNAALGKILRIDPSGSNSANGQYGNPPTNPFVGIAGLDEIYALGFRNPWRISFDRMTGELWAPDVGQNDIEEINLVIAGGDYGWRSMEGSFFFVFNGNMNGYVTNRPLSVPAGLQFPIVEYDHDEGIAVVGGFVYRGSKIPQLVGEYVCGDFAQTFSNDGRLFFVHQHEHGHYELHEFQYSGRSELGMSLLGFGEDAAGDIYVLANGTGTPFGTTGLVMRIVILGDMNCDGLTNFDDIDAFVAALISRDAYLEAQPDCNFGNGDVNGDGAVNFDDIDGFIGCLILGACP